MINAETRYRASTHEIKNQPVNGVENLRQFYPDRRQIVHVKKAAIINFFGSDPPVSEPVGLCIEQFIKRVEAARISRLAVDPGQRLFNCLLNLRRFRATPFETSLDNFLLANALRDALPVGFSALG